MKTLSGFCAALLFLLPAASRAQVNSGSNGSDGALNPTANLVINMADHPDGIYHYTSVNIPAGVTVSFIPNSANKPVVWLVQGSCVIAGEINLRGSSAIDGSGAIGGAGGWRGGNAGIEASTSGQGPGGGSGCNFGLNSNPQRTSGGGSYATSAIANSAQGAMYGAGVVYGNVYLLPLLGGSGGGGHYFNYYGSSSFYGGGGGGGAMLIATSNSLTIDGMINASGGNALSEWSGCGSGGGVRLVTPSFSGIGSINVNGTGHFRGSSGAGRIRIDSLQSTFGGGLHGSVTQGFQPIIIPAVGQGIQLTIASIAGNAISLNPSGVLVNPDVIIPAQQANPIPIVVNCSNIPLNSEISVIVRPANGPDVQAVGINNAGTLAASTATISLHMPRGGGIIYAKCVSGLAGLGADNSSKELRTRSLAETGWTADGERFAKMEITAALGGQQQITYITESGKRHSLVAR